MNTTEIPPETPASLTEKLKSLVSRIDSVHNQGIEKQLEILDGVRIPLGTIIQFQKEYLCSASPRGRIKAGSYFKLIGQSRFELELQRCSADGKQHKHNYIRKFYKNGIGYFSDILVTHIPTDDTK
jgi:hypothetical protein